MSGVSQYPRRPPTLQLGLRLQIVLALAGLMLLAFVPLFFAVASLTRATVADARERAARGLARVAVGRAVEAAERGGADAVARALAEDVSAGEAVAACVFARDGSRLACVGPPSETDALRVPGDPAGGGDGATWPRRAHGRVVEAAAARGGLRAVLLARVDDAAERGSTLVRLVALYMTTFGLALLVFAYLVLTRLIVRPVEQLVGAADRVASGARTLRVPRSGARELVELGASVQAMAEKLISEEAALILKVDELTETTTRLRDARSQLVRSERMASVGRLAAGVAHEIGNPLAALMGMQDLLLDGHLPRETETDFLARMRRETERIHTVVRGLLDFARPEGTRSGDGAAGAGEGGHAAPANVKAVALEVAALVRPQKDFRRVALETDVPDALEVALSAPRLTQVLLNLVLNAGAAIAKGGRDQGRVLVRARPAGPGRAVRIEVEDDGPGVDPALRERLFEPFVTTKAVGEGTGLGLAVCRGLVESAGGEVGLDAAYAGGARFYVTLPAPLD